MLQCLPNLRICFSLIHTNFIDLKYFEQIGKLDKKTTNAFEELLNKIE